MQPYFFPYLGYFDLLRQCDLFVVYDLTQFPKQGWVNRNRVLHPTEDWQYITVPLEKASFTDSYRTTIDKIRVSGNPGWQDGLLQQLAPYQDHAPYFATVYGLLEEVLNSAEPGISKLDMRAIRRVAELLGLDFEMQALSELNIPLSEKASATEKVLQICRALEATTYINLAGGRDLYDADEFEHHGIQLEFTNTTAMNYDTGPFDYQENLSMLDVMMWNPAAAIQEQLAGTGGNQDE